MKEHLKDYLKIALIVTIFYVPLVIALLYWILPKIAVGNLVGGN